MTAAQEEIVVRNTQEEDFPAIVEISREIYGLRGAWSERELGSHLRVFPGGQFVAEDRTPGRVMGFAASLVVLWDEYSIRENWWDFTDNGMFTNHDPQGRTLYGAGVAVRPSAQGRGVGAKLYQARRELAGRLHLVRIRAGARLSGYSRFADRMSAEAYAIRVINEEENDPTLSFQLRMGFHVLAVVRDYLPEDRESLGYAAVIEWINHRAARPGDYAGRNPKFIQKT